MEKYRGVDYYGVESLLSDEERMVRDAVRDWVEAEFLPLVTEHHRAGTFPMAIVPAARASWASSARVSRATGARACRTSPTG